MDALDVAINHVLLYWIGLDVGDDKKYEHKYKCFARDKYCDLCI